MSYCRDPIYLYCSISDNNLHCHCREHHGDMEVVIVVPKGESFVKYAAEHMKYHIELYEAEREYEKAELLANHIEHIILWNMPIVGRLYRWFSCKVGSWIENEEGAKFSRWWV